ncbi:uncharacterized protein LOC123011913 isoform X2 [Tribolium madens]|uniref:uncharacterized protein LOC123011913 isoform X2 n=1 Tax=Tribolium madens TaxID=41895 RepID=UPI001CF749EE|nr:uncharacterized protein LOC123011913 isoform X2 [Tribolium madens]
MSSFVVLIVFFYLTSIVTTNEMIYVNNRHLLNVIPIQNDGKKAEVSKAEETKDNVETVHVKNEAKVEPQLVKPQEAPHPDPKKTIVNKTSEQNQTKIEDHKVFKSTEMESGALLRGVSVIVILTALVIVYMALKTYCGKKSKQPVMVSKYGVRTRRSDIEMTPLPLDEDEEDETLFELHNTNR